MIAILLLARFALAQGPAPLSPQAPPPPPTTTSAGEPQSVAAPVEKQAPPSPPVVDYTAHFDLGSYEAVLGDIASAYPDLVRVRSLGKSREGKDVWLAVVADTSAGDASRLPAALVATSLRAPAHGPEPVLFALAQLLAAARSDASVRARLRRVAVYFLPALDPDAAFPSPAPIASDAPASDSASPLSNGHVVLPSERGLEPRRARLDRDLPARWTPFGDAAPSGPYPLAEPESRLLAHFLVERTNLSAVVVMGAPGAPDALGGLGTHGALGTNASDPAGTAVADAACEPGSLEAFCLVVLDVALVRPAPWSGAPRRSTIGNAPEGFHAAAALVRDLAEDLPRLECAAAKVERLRPDLWVVDLSVANEGRLSSAGRSAQAVEASSLRLRTNGGRVVACAVRRAGADSYESLRPVKSAWPLGELGGKQGLAVRLVVQANEGSAVEAVFEGARGGRARAEIDLR